MFIFLDNKKVLKANFIEFVHHHELLFKTYNFLRHKNSRNIIYDREIIYKSHNV